MNKLDPKSLRIGNTVTIDNDEYWRNLKGVEFTVAGIELFENNRDFPNSTASVSLIGPHGRRYSQFNEFLSGIPLSEQELIRLGFRLEEEARTPLPCQSTWEAFFCLLTKHLVILKVFKKQSKNF